MKILLFDDHRIFGESLSKLLEDWDEISICRYVSNETEFWNILSVDEWDIVLLDVNLREQSKSSGIDLIETIYSKKPKIKVVMLSSYDMPVVADGLFCREIDGLFCRSSPDIIVRRRCVLSHKRRGWLEPSPSFRYSRNLALQDELYHPVINNGPAVLVCVDKRLGTGPVNQSRDAG